MGNRSHTARALAKLAPEDKRAAILKLNDLVAMIGKGGICEYVAHGLLEAAETAYQVLSDMGYAYQGITQWGLMETLKQAIAQARGE